ncbi:MAG: Ig domain-containing protein, partial [Vicinamibacterales bacterium]
MRTSIFRILCGLVVAGAVSGAELAVAANYPLELSNFRSGMSSNHRHARAYPGIEYNVRAGVVGGAYPFTFSLSNAPSGMTIDSRTGTITWPNPQANASPTITVVDSEGTRISATWTITVTTNGFKFIDANNGRNAANNGCSSSCGTGTLSNPWRTVRDMYQNGVPSDFIYFRNGT